MTFQNQLFHLKESSRSANIPPTEAEIPEREPLDEQPSIADV